MDNGSTYTSPVHVQLRNVCPHERVDGQKDDIQDGEQQGSSTAQRGGRLQGRRIGVRRFTSSDNRENETEETEQGETTESNVNPWGLVKCTQYTVSLISEQPETVAGGLTQYGRNPACREEGETTPQTRGW